MIEIFPDQSKIDLDSLIKEFQVINVDAFKVYLATVWKDLTSRSDNKYLGINKITFAKYYELPGIISDRLFNVLDSQQTEYLDLESFVRGMLVLFTKGFDELVKFVFSLYDFDNDGKVSKEDVRVLLSYIPLNRGRLKKLKGIAENEHFEQRIESQNELHKTLDMVFEGNKHINQKEFIHIIEHINSDIFLFILIFLLEKRPFNEKTIELLENIKKSPKLEKSPKFNKLIASPTLNSVFQPSSTISRSPGFVKTKSLTHAKIELEKEERIKKNQEQLSKQNSLLLNLAGIRLNKTTRKSTPQIKPNVNMTSKKNDEMISQIKAQERHHEKHTLPSRKGRKILNELNSADNNTNNDSTLHLTDEMLFEPVRHFESISSSAPHAQCNETETDSSEENVNDDNSDDDDDEGNEEQQDKIKGNYSGYIYKVLQTNKLRKMWFSLVYKDLYFYKSKDDPIHKGMHNLSGVFLKEEPDTVIENKRFHVFSIITGDKPKKYYVKDKEEYLQWICNLKKAIGYSNLNDIYEMKQELAKGKYGVIKLGMNKQTQEHVAIKILCKYNMSIVDLEHVKTEIETMKIANHPNIIKLYDVFENEKMIYIIMEYCEGGDLFSYIEQRNFNIKEERTAHIIQQLSTAVYYLHEYGVVHRDLKPENILLRSKGEDSKIKLCDFGISKILGPGELCADLYGTVSYVAPEILLGKPYNKNVDLWSIGVVMYLLLSGFLPFDDEESEKEIIRQTIEDEVPYTSEVWKHISNEAKDLLRSLLCKDPEKRVTIKEVLEHPWFEKFCKKSLTKAKSPVISKNEKVSGGMEFQRYSSSTLNIPLDERSATNSNELISVCSADNDNNSSNMVYLGSKGGCNNTLRIPLPNLNLPIYKNQSPSAHIDNYEYKN